MADKDIDQIINDPINPEDFKSSDFPSDEEVEQINIEDEEIDPIGDMALDDNSDNDLDDEEFNMELNLSDEDEINNLDQDQEINMVAPEEQIKWTSIPQENGDIWSEHINGFILRARPLSSKKGEKIKYTAQLFKNNKMVESGVIWIDKNKDAREFLQNISDRILDRLNLVNVSNMKAKPENEEDLGL